MNYRELLYKNALEIIGNIYEKSKYHPEVDLYRSIDIIHSLSAGQIESKQWLVDTLMNYVDKDNLNCIMIAGSWYGLIGVMLREHISPDVYIRNVDSDEMTIGISGRLSSGSDLYKRNQYVIDDAINYFFDTSKEYDVIINTSCEHMESEDIRFFVEGKKPETILCMQANNYDSVQSHINTYSSLEEFIEDLDLGEVLYSDKKDMGEYERYMVIGK